MRIAVVMDDEIVNAAYRATVPFNALAAKGHEIRWDVKLPGRYDLKVLAACDLVYIHRHFDEPTQRMARTLRDLGVGLWWDNDDDIRALPRGAPGYDAVGGLRGKRIFAGMAKMMRLADLVSTPSAVLAQRYRAIGVESVVLIENYVPDEFANVRSTRAGAGLVIGWIAGLEHRLDADELALRATLDQVCERLRNVQVVSIGVDLNLTVKESYRHVPSVRFEEVGGAVAAFDVGLAPIADNDFNRARSDIKLKEYAAVGTPWLASAVGPYLNLGESQGGRLVPDDAWGAEIERLLTNARARKRLSKRAAKWGRAQTIGANVHRWEAAAQEVIERARSRASGGRVAVRSGG